MIRRPPRSTLFPNTPLSRSGGCPAEGGGKNQKRSGAALARLGRAVKEGVDQPPYPHHHRHAEEAEAERREEQHERQGDEADEEDRKSTRLNSSHLVISYAVF